MHRVAEAILQPQPCTRTWAQECRRPRRLDRIWPYLNFNTLFAALLIVHLLPIWIFTYFPSQDGPAHIYNARILVDGLDPANFQIRQVYTFNYSLPPNILTHVILAGLLLVFPPLIAEKVLVSLLVSLVPLSMLYMLRGIQLAGRRPAPGGAQDDTANLEVFSLAGFLFASHNLLHMGFYNFSMSIPLVLFSVGWWWRHKEQMTAGRIGVFYLLALLAYTAHFAGFMALVLALLVTGGWSWLLRSGRTLKLAILRRPDAMTRRQLGSHLRWGLIFAGYMLPLLLLAWDYNFRTRAPERESYPPQQFLDTLFWQSMAIVSYSDWLQRLRPLSMPRDINIVLWVIAAAGGLTILYRLLRGQWLLERDGLLFTCAILAYLYFTMPRGRNAGGWVNDRLYLLGMVLLWMWFGRFHKPFRIAIGTALVALSLLHTAHLAYDYHRLQPELREFAAAVELVEPHSTLNVDLNNRFRPREFPGNTQNVGPFWHAHAYYGLGRDIALFNNYEAAYDYFFTGWGETRRARPDYIVTWGHRPGGQHLRQYRNDYEMIHSSENLTLLRLQRQEPDMQPWSELEDGRLMLRLRMMPPRRRAGGDIDAVAVQRDRIFSSGSFGWVRNAPRREWRGGDTTNTFADLVGDNRDRAFRVDLPNGRYRVTAHFPPHPGGSYEVNVIANGHRVIQRRVIEEDEEPVAMQYMLDVTDGHITHVFYTTRRGSHPERRRPAVWALGGLEIEQAGGEW